MRNAFSPICWKTTSSISWTAKSRATFDPGSFIQSVADTADFDDAVARHCSETTFIMRAFARDWLGKNPFHLDKKLSRDDVAGFASYAFTKIRNELCFRGLHNEAVRVRLRRRRAGRIDSDSTLGAGCSGRRKNVNLRISDISRSMVSNIPDLLLDLLEWPPTSIAPTSTRRAGLTSS